ncbi:hypothetical protein ES708_26733 [subsurface metagenome]
MGTKYKILEHEDFKKDFKDRSYYNEGVESLDLSLWEDFRKVVKIFNGNTDYIWRGQRCYPEQIDISTNNKGWKLISTFDRYYKPGKIKLNEIFNNFKKRLLDLPDTHNIDFTKNYEIWAIGQHYGLPTPLLDWTKNPNTAAYFAFYKKKDKNQTKDRVVYALNRVLERYILKEKDPKTHELVNRQQKIDFDFDFDMSHFSSEHRLRLINQESAFTRAYKGKDIKSIVQNFWERDSKRKKNYTNSVILTEILIPDKFHKDCLTDLKFMNITHGKLFPDDAGAVDICKIDLNLGNLKESPANLSKINYLKWLPQVVEF